MKYCLLFFIPFFFPMTLATITQENTAQLRLDIVFSGIDAQGNVIVAPNQAYDDVKQIATVTFNRQEGLTQAHFKGLINTTSPIKNKAIQTLSMSLPGTISIAQDKTLSIINQNKELATATFHDALGNAITQPIGALANTNEYVLAEIKDTKNDPNIALLGISPNAQNLAQYNHTGAYDRTTASNNKALSILNYVTGNLTPITIDPTQKMCIYYDDYLDISYIGITIKNSITDDSEGTILLLARLQHNVDGISAGSKQLVITPALGKNDKDWIHLFFDLMGDNDLIISNTHGNTLGILNISVMHTSTGRDYIIFVQKKNEQIAVYSLPLMPPNNDETGKLAAFSSNGDFYIPYIQDGAPKGIDLLQDFYHTNIVGNDMAFLNYAKKTNISALRTLGDTVYIAVNGNQNSTLDGKSVNDQAGIFASRAIFNQHGIIFLWTPWQKVAATGNAKIKSFEVHPSSGIITYITQDEPQKTKTAHWIGNKKGSLAQAINDYFNDGFGVLGLFNIDAYTPAFKTPQIEQKNKNVEVPYYSMMIATGFNKVALIQTGIRDTKFFVATKNFECSFSGDKTILLYDTTKNQPGEALTKLGPIITADVARTQAKDKGWLFVGSSKGVAVLSDNLGNGWDASGAPLNQQYFLNNLTFKHLIADNGENIFLHTRKLIATQNYLFIMTHKSIYRISLNSKNFKPDSSDPCLARIPKDEVITIASCSYFISNGDATILNNNIDEFYDMLIICNGENNGSLLIASSKGLFFSKNDPTISPLYDYSINNDSADVNRQHIRKYNWQRPLHTNDNKPLFLGPIFKLESISLTLGGRFSTNPTSFPMDAELNGNIYALGNDQYDNNLNIYRFFVTDGSLGRPERFNVYLIREPHQQDYFCRIGSLQDNKPLFLLQEYDFQLQTSEIGNHGILGDFTSSHLAPAPLSYTQCHSKPFDLNLDLSQNIQLTTVVQDSTSGCCYTYGQFGIRSLE